MPVSARKKGMGMVAFSEFSLIEKLRTAAQVVGGPLPDFRAGGGQLYDVLYYLPRDELRNLATKSS